MGAIAKIEEINFPTGLNPGDPIIGTVTLSNVGDEVTSSAAGLFGVLITTLWDGAEHTLFASSSTAPGETFTFYFHSGTPAGTMPDGDAEMEVIGRIWLGYNGGYRADDTKIFNLLTGVDEPAPPPEPPPPTATERFPQLRERFPRLFELFDRRPKVIVA